MSDEPKLEPCPNPECRESDPRHASLDEVHWCFCRTCGLSGPESRGGDDWVQAEAEARELWNALPRAPRWTSEPPKLPGLYLIRYDDWASGSCRYKADLVDATEIKRCVDLSTYWDVMSIGPIPEPVDPPAEGGAA